MSEQKIGLTEGLLIAGVPAVGYWLAFLYQLGYCTYFNIPTSLIEISLLNILVAIIGLTSILLLINLYGEPFYMIYSSLPKVLRPAIVKVGAPLIFMSGYALVNRIPLKQFYIITGILIGAFAFLEFIFPLITQRQTKGYLAKLKAQNKIDYQYDSLMDTVAKNLGKEKFVVFLLLISLSFITFFAGGYNAKTKIDFVVLEKPTNSVVLKTYNDKFVAAEYNKESQTVTAEYRLIPIKESNFKVNDVGPLTPAQN